MRCIEIKNYCHFLYLQLSWTDTWDVLKCEDTTIAIEDMKLELIHEMYWNSSVLPSIFKALLLELIHEMYWNKIRYKSRLVLRYLNWYMRCIEINIDHQVQNRLYSWTDTWDVLKSTYSHQRSAICELELIHEMYWNNSAKINPDTSVYLNWYMRCIEIIYNIATLARSAVLNWYMRCIEIKLKEQRFAEFVDLNWYMRCIEISRAIQKQRWQTLELIHEMYWNSLSTLTALFQFVNLNWYMRCIEMIDLF